MGASLVSVHEDNRLLQAKYNITAWFYDILDYPWERQYRNWRPVLLRDVRGEVLDAGVGSGRNLKYYPANVNLTGIDLCLEMLRRAMKRGRAALCHIDLRQEDATIMKSIPSSYFDWLVSTFLCCVMLIICSRWQSNSLNGYSNLAGGSDSLKWSTQEIRS